jgi:hypothetical protein
MRRPTVVLALGLATLVQAPAEENRRSDDRLLAMPKVRATAAALLVIAGLSVAVQAAEPATLTLACKGTVTIKASSPTEYEPDPVSMGLIVNFTTRTVQGTARWGPYLFDDQLQITEWNEMTVVFRGFSRFLGMDISGSMDRVTGDVGMLATSKTLAQDYSLRCTPTQRMF